MGATACIPLNKEYGKVIQGNFGTEKKERIYKEYSEFTSDGRPKPTAADYIPSLTEINRIRDYYLENWVKKNDIRFLRYYMLVTVGICFGMRLSDLLQIRIKDVVDNDFVVKYEKKTGKLSSNVNDKVWITPAARDAINLYLNNLKSYKPDDLLFKSCRSGDDNKALARCTIDQSFKKAQDELKLDFHFSSHSLRKTFATIPILNGDLYKKINPQYVEMAKIMLKHSSTDSTMSYIGALLKFTKQARFFISDFLQGKTPYDDIDSFLMNGDG